MTDSMGPRATVEFVHQDVQFAKGRREGDDEDAYFVQENLAWGSWFRIPRADYDAAIARCRADPTANLVVFSKQTTSGQVNLTFWPAEADLYAIGYRTDDLIEPPDEFGEVPVITAPQLGWHQHLNGVSADAA